MPGLSIVQVQLSDKITDSKKEFSDMNLKLNALSLPQGAGPIKFNSDFGDTAALMLTVASPLEDASAISVRAHGVTDALEKYRAARKVKGRGERVSWWCVSRARRRKTWSRARFGCSCDRPRWRAC